MGVRINDPNDLKSINSNLVYLYKQSNIGTTQSKTNTTLSVASQPQVLVPGDVKDAYVRNDWRAIKNYENKANNDLQPLYNYIKNNGNASWVVVQDSYSSYFNMIWDNLGNFIYTTCASVNPNNNDPFHPNVPLVAPVYYGIFSKSTSICGIHAYNLGVTTMITELAASTILSFFICKLLKKGVNFLAEDLFTMFSEAATEAGLSFLFGAVSLAVTALCAVAVFAIVFIGIMVLFNFLNKRFQISVSVYNWDTSCNWQLRGQALSNAVNPGESGTNDLNLDIVKQVPAGWSPVYNNLSIPISLAQVLVRTTQGALNYGYVAYENKKTFTQGCSFSFQCTRNNDPNVGFTYAFQCPWTASNAHYIENGVQDANQFLDKARHNWLHTTGPLTMNVNGTLIHAFIDALKGGDEDGDDNYKVAIHINSPYPN